MNRVPIGTLLITHLRDKAAVRCATDGATRWMPTGGWRNVLIEADNEWDVGRHDHAVAKPDRMTNSSAALGRRSTTDTPCPEYQLCLRVVINGGICICQSGPSYGGKEFRRYSNDGGGGYHRRWDRPPCLPKP